MLQEQRTKVQLGGGRNYAIDLLRILSMFMIVILHSGSHGRMLFISEGINFYTIWFHFIEALSICSVDIFVIISGYFLCTQVIKPSRIIRIYLVVLFYSVAWCFLTTLLTDSLVDAKEIIKAFLPVSYNRYWFISCYLGLCVLSPLINVFIKNLTQGQHLGTIVLLVAVFSVWPDILPHSEPLGIADKGYTIVWFIVLYIIAAYLRRYPVVMKVSIAFRYYMLAALTLLASWIIIVIVTNTNSFENELRGQISFYYYRYNSLMVLASSVFLFIAFGNIKVENKHLQRIIAFVAPLCMGVYLIHDNPSARDFVWQGLRLLEPKPSTVFLVLLYVVIVFVVCLIIDKARSLLFTLFEKREWYENLLQKIDEVPFIIKESINKQLQNF